MSETGAGAEPNDIEAAVERAGRQRHLGGFKARIDASYVDQLERDAELLAGEYERLREAILDAIVNASDGAAYELEALGVVLDGKRDAPNETA